MSLINDVLRDLDERRLGRADGERGDDPLDGLHPAPSREPATGWRRGGRDGRAGRGEWARELVVLALVIASGAALLVSVPDEPEPRALPPVAADAPAGPRVVEAQTPVETPRAIPPIPPAPIHRAPEPAPPARRAPAGTLETIPQAASAAVPARRAPLVEAPVPRGSVSERRAGSRRAYRRALERAARGESAREALEESVALDPAHRPARAALATLLARSGNAADSAAALALLAEGRRLAGEPRAFTVLEARIRAERGEVDEALGLLEQGTPPLPHGADAHGLRAALYQRAGRHDEAADLYAELLGRVGARGVWWVGLGISREAEGRAGEALSAYRAAQRSPQGAGALDPATRSWVAARIASLVRSSAPPSER